MWSEQASWDCLGNSREQIPGPRPLDAVIEGGRIDFFDLRSNRMGSGWFRDGEVETFGPQGNWTGFGRGPWPGGVRSQDLAKRWLGGIRPDRGWQNSRVRGLGGGLMKESGKTHLMGRHIVADSRICHGKPVFRGTRILVLDVLEQVASGLAWETILEEWDNGIPEEAIEEAVRLASQALLKHANEFILGPAPA
jgi:uncharacterized protein (DUF433 family)